MPPPEDERPRLGLLDSSTDQAEPARPRRRILAATVSLLAAAAVLAILLVSRGDESAVSTVTVPSATPEPEESGEASPTPTTSSPDDDREVTTRPLSTVLVEPESVPGPAAELSIGEPTGQTIHVSPGAEGGSGTEDQPFGTIGAAVRAASSGDVVLVGEGEYDEYVTSVRSGTPESPIRITTEEGAHIRGEDHDGRLVTITHDHIVFDGFELSGADKLIWLEGAEGTRILGNHLHDAGGECLRIKYFSTDNEIAGNLIEDCGVVGFDLDDDSKVGEGIYVGTAPEQLDRNPSSEPDESNRNWIHHNVIDTRAECIEFKESSSDNVADSNQCRGSDDPEGAGMASRGSWNVFYANLIEEVEGAGFRLGGDDEDQGLSNLVVGNVIDDAGGPAVRAPREPQATVCGNVVGDTDEEGDGSLDADGPCQWPITPRWSE